MLKLRRHKAWRKEREFGRGQLEDSGGVEGRGIPFAPGCIDKPGSQLVQAEATPTAHAPLTPAPLLSLALLL